MKRSTETRRSQAEINADSQRHYGGLAELPTDKKASENIHQVSCFLKALKNECLESG